jgi:hypothetical protein
MEDNCMETFINETFIDDIECDMCHENEDYALAIEVATQAESFESKTTINLCPSCLKSLSEQYFDLLGED